ncbi:MAG: maleylpyruvate isomerase family mycothiol-dependent enzyme [Antricoccus sp.]
MASYNRDAIVAAYIEEFGALDQLFSEIPDDAWHRPSDLPGWDVQAIAAHVLGTEYMLLGEKPTSTDDASDLAHVHNDIAARNEQWVRTMASDSPQQMRERLVDIVARRSAALTEMTQADFDAESWTPIGQDTYGHFMHIRIFDIWLHEQDIRDAVGIAGHDAGPAVDIALDEIAGALGYIVGRKAKLPSGTTVRISLYGATERTFLIEVADRAKVVDHLNGEATTSIEMTVNEFARLTGGRGEPQRHIDKVSVTGNTELGNQLLRSMAFTI